MRKIKIMCLTLENFKCHRHLTLRLDGCNATLYGDNATGKTSVYDALTWLLFGKDSAGNGEKNVEIKPLDPMGAVADHNAITSVEAELSVDGATTTLKRAYREVWSCKRGSAKETYDGNTSEYYIDGVPCKKYAYDQRIAEMVPEETFRLLTSVSCFARDLPWQKRRGILFDMSGSPDDRTILAQDMRFAPLLAGMGRLSLEDYRRKLLAERKSLMGAKSDIPARISENQHLVQSLESLDFAGARAALETLQGQLDAASGKLLALEHTPAAEGLRLELQRLRLERDKLQNTNTQYRREQAANLPDTAKLQRDLENVYGQIRRLEAQRGRAETTATDCRKAIADARAKWIATNGEQFHGAACPTCGQALPQHQLQSARATFDAQKQRHLREIESLADSRKAMLAQAEETVRQLEASIAESREAAAQLEAALETAKQTPEPRDLEGFPEKLWALETEIADVSHRLDTATQGTAAARGPLLEEIAELRKQIQEQTSVCSREAVLEDARRRAEALRQEAQSAARQLEAVDAMLALAEAFTRYKTRFVEDGVNSLFRIARFRLFREQANGGVEERCDVVYDGVPYIGLNNGMKINVGIDMINRLSQHYGVSVPLFIDNAESVTQLEPAETQVIRLVVSESDKKLRCDYEN